MERGTGGEQDGAWCEVARTKKKGGGEEYDKKNDEIDLIEKHFNININVCSHDEPELLQIDRRSMCEYDDTLNLMRYNRVSGPGVWARVQAIGRGSRFRYSVYVRAVASTKGGTPCRARDRCFRPSQAGSRGPCRGWEGCWGRAVPVDAICCICVAGSRSCVRAVSEQAGQTGLLLGRPSRLRVSPSRDLKFRPLSVARAG